METKDRDKIRAAAEKANPGGEQRWELEENGFETANVISDGCYMVACTGDSGDWSFSEELAEQRQEHIANFIALTDPDTVIELLDALDSAEKLWDIKEWPCQTHLRAKTMEKHLEQIQTMFGDKLDSPLQQQNRELILENTRLREALENTTKCNTKDCDEVISTSYCSKCRKCWES